MLRRILVGAETVSSWNLIQSHWTRTINIVFGFKIKVFEFNIGHCSVDSFIRFYLRSIIKFILLLIILYDIYKKLFINFRLFTELIKEFEILIATWTIFWIVWVVDFLIFDIFNDFLNLLLWNCSVVTSLRCVWPSLVLSTRSIGCIFYRNWRLCFWSWFLHTFN